MSHILSTPFFGQYLSSFQNREGHSSYLMINVDPDKKGVGVAYIISLDGKFSIFNCIANIDEHGVIFGKATRSERLEKIHNQNYPLTEAEKQECSFRIELATEYDRLIYQERGKQVEESLEPIGSSNKAEAKQITTWDEFKKWARSVKVSDRDSVFRGVARAEYGLKTSFHRTGRVDLERYRDKDMPVFTDLAETIGGLRFDGDVGSIWGFAQHHGFPTPLLDWTESPYIAAYFAFLDRLEKQTVNDTEKVRIYYLNGQFVNENRPANVQMANVYPRVWIFRPNSKGNQRLIFQQGVFLHSDVVDIESYLLYLSNKKKLPVVAAIEMSATLAPEALEELSYMGVNHLSLFPGLDGAAKYAKFKQFYRGN